MFISKEEKHSIHVGLSCLEDYQHKTCQRIARDFDHCEKLLRAVLEYLDVDIIEVPAAYTDKVYKLKKRVSGGK